MFSQLRRCFPASKAHRRKLTRRFCLEGLETRALLTLTPINFSSTVGSTPVAINGDLFFLGTDSSHGAQLWVYNSTTGGATMLTDLNLNHGGCYPQDLTAVGSTLFFAANDGTHGHQLWESNGTTSGTVMVTDITVQNGGFYPSNLTNDNGTLYFTAYGPSDGNQLWKSNGTASGTVQVADINGTYGSYPADLTPASGGVLYFAATESTSGNQLWETNGTAGGTIQLTTNNGGSLPNLLTPVDNTVYFSGFDPTNGLQLWETNGTAGGTVRLTSGNITNGGLDPSNLTALGNTLLFTANDGTHGSQLWESQGTTSTTTMITDINASYGGILVSYPTVMNGTLYFAGDDGTDGTQLWESNGTAAGTTMVADINGTSTANVESLLAIGDTLYFAAVTTTAGWQVWQSNGTAAGTVMDTNLDTGNNNIPTHFVASGSDLDFTAPGASMWQLTATPTPTPTPTATFLKTDTTTRGSWIGTYGAQGYDVIGDTPSLSPYATVTPSGELTHVWAASSTAPQALQNPGGSGRIEAAWYATTSFTVNLDLTDGQAHDVELYVLDLQSSPARVEQIQISDALTGTVLSTETVSSFTGGVYLNWKMSGDVVITITRESGVNAVLSGIFIDPPPQASSATFLQTDTTTRGSWIGTYGAQGYDVIGDTPSLSPYATVTPSGELTHVWAASSTAPQALQNPGGSGRIEAAWYATTSFTVNLDLTDGQAHDVELYVLDLQSSPARVEQIQISDASTGTVLSTETVSSFTGGVYLNWKMSGDVVITITRRIGCERSAQRDLHRPGDDTILGHVPSDGHDDAGPLDRGLRRTGLRR